MGAESNKCPHLWEFVGTSIPRERGGGGGGGRGNGGARGLSSPGVVVVAKRGTNGILLGGGRGEGEGGGRRARERGRGGVE